MTRDQAELLALEGLQFIAGDEDQLSRFLALTGISPADLREAATSTALLSGILDYFMGDEPTLIAFAATRNRKPQDIAIAREVLSLADRGR